MILGWESPGEVGNIWVVIDWIARRKWWWVGVIVLALLAGWVDRWLVRREHSQDSHILAAARKYGLEPALVKAVVWRESSFNPRARGSKGEVGLMQISEIAAREWAAAEKLPSFRHAELFDPAKNTMAGSWYLAKVMRRYMNTDNPYRYALADYNAGRANVLQWINGAGSTNSEVFLKQIDYPGTRRYVRSILQRYGRYRAEFMAKSSPTRKS